MLGNLKTKKSLAIVAFFFIIFKLINIFFYVQSYQLIRSLVRNEGVSLFIVLFILLHVEARTGLEERSH